MRARSGSWLLCAIPLLLGAVDAGAGTDGTLGWTWDQVRFEPGATGSAACSVDGASLHLSRPGEPDLPAVLVKIPAPERSRVASFQIVGEVTSDHDPGFSILPAVQDAPSSAGGPRYVPPDRSAYGAPAFPAERVRFLGLRFERGQAMADFAVYPLVLLSGAKVRLLERGTLTVQWQADPSVAAPLKVLRQGAAAAGLDLRFTRTLRGPAGVVTDRPSLNGNAVPYVIVTVRADSAAIRPLADWKIATGSLAQIRTKEWILANYTDGVDQQEKIRNFIRDAYQYWGTQYVLIVGDPSAVPIRLAKFYSWNAPYGVDIITDYYYACLDGSWNANGNAIFGEPQRASNPTVPVGDDVDFAPDVYVGRVPAGSPSDVTVWVNKYLSHYTQNPDTGGYLDRMLMLGEVLFDESWTRSLLPTCATGPCPQSCHGICVISDGAQDCVRVIDIVDAAPDVTMQYNELYEYYEYWNDQGRPNAKLEKRADVIAAINQGNGWVHHVGHGDRDRMSIGTVDGNDGNARLLVADANALTNGNKIGVIYAIDCNSAAVDYDCVANALLFNPNGGGIAYIGSTNLDFPAAATNYEAEFYTKLFQDKEPTLGQAYYETMNDLSAGLGDGENFYRFMTYSLIFLGDPQMHGWLGTPSTIAVTAPNSMSLGDSTFTVVVRKASDQTPVPGARVCVYKSGDVFAVANSDTSGTAVVPFRPTTTGAFQVTVTGATSIPYYEQSPAHSVQAPSGAAVTVTGIAVVDGGRNGTTGNQNGRLEEGETVDIDVSLNNGGGAAATNVGLLLKVGPDSLGSFMNIIQGSTTVASISANTPAQVAGAFRVQPHLGSLDRRYQGGERLAYVDSVIVQVAGHSTVFPLPMPAYRPRFDLEHAVMTEAPGGNGDGHPDNGETMLWTPNLRVVGTGSAANLHAVMDSVSGAHILVRSVALQPGDRGQIVSSTTPLSFLVTDATNLRVSFKVRSDLDSLETPYFLTRTIQFSPPTQPIFPPDQPPSATKDAVVVTWSPPGGLPDIVGYILERSAAPDTATYVRVNTSRLLTEMRYYRDEGLSGLTRYYYRVTAVDSSGNWSPPSGRAAATTSPAVLAGWPFTIPQEANLGSPTIENVKQHGPLQVFLSGYQLYGINYDGTEITDGDGVPSTPGVFGAEGTYFWGKPAIGDLNGDGRPEIVATSRKETNNVGTGQVHVWAYSKSDTTHADSLLWERSVGNTDYMLSSPVLAHIAGPAGKMQVICTSRGSIYAWNADGTPVIAGHTDGLLAYTGGGDPTVAPLNYGSAGAADLDGDGLEDVVYSFLAAQPANTCQLVAVKGDGTVLGQMNLETAPVNAPNANSSVAIASLGDTVGYRMFVATRNYLWCCRYRAGAGLLKVWQVQIPTLPTNWTEPTPAIGDIDGDGALDVVVGAGSGQLVAVHASDGTPLPGYPYQITQQTAKVGSPILVNLDSNIATAEVVVGDNQGNVFAIDGATQQPLPGFPYQAGGRFQHGLACWDIDRDGHPDLVLQGEQLPVVTILSMTNATFPGDLTTAMAENPWPSFRHDARNTGRIDAHVVTPVMQLSVQTRVEPGAAILMWKPGLADPSLFRVQRQGSDAAWTTRAEGPPSTFTSEGGYQYRDLSDPGTFTYRVVGLDNRGQVVLQTDDMKLVVPPFSFQLVGVIPNPSHPRTTIRYETPGGAVALDIFDPSGRRVRSLVSGRVQPGLYDVVWDGRDQSGHDVGAGVYFARLRGPQGTRHQKVVLLR